MNDILLDLLRLAISLVPTIWIYSGALILLVRVKGIEPYLFIRNTFHELKPFYLPCYVISFILGSMDKPRSWWEYILFILGFLAYWVYKNVDKDDRWKKRKEKLSEKVAQVGSKLAVIPT